MTELETRAYNHADAGVESLATEPRPSGLQTKVEPVTVRALAWEDVGGPD